MAARLPRGCTECLTPSRAEGDRSGPPLTQLRNSGRVLSQYIWTQPDLSGGMHEYGPPDRSPRIRPNNKLLPRSPALPPTCSYRCATARESQPRARPSDNSGMYKHSCFGGRRDILMNPRFQRPRRRPNIAGRKDIGTILHHLKSRTSVYRPRMLKPEKVNGGPAASTSAPGSAPSSAPGMNGDGRYGNRSKPASSPIRRPYAGIREKFQRLLARQQLGNRNQAIARKSA